MSFDPGQKLNEVTGNISCAIFEGRIHLAHPIRVTTLISAPLRGLAGWMLLQYEPELFRNQFKPGQGGHRPGACLFQLASRPKGRQRHFRFRCITWDRNLVLGSALHRILPLAVGRPLGRGTTLIDRVTVGEVRQGTLLEMASGNRMKGEQYLVLVTPTMLRAGGGRWQGPDGMGVSQLTAAAVQRVNLLSRVYGGGQELDALEWQMLASGATVDYSSWRWQSSQRFSHTQKNAIKLSGVSGFCRLGQVPEALLELFSKVSLLHIGKHTADGCGRMGLVSASRVRIRLPSIRHKIVSEYRNL